jgi:predicted ATPase
MPPPTEIPAQTTARPVLASPPPAAGPQGLVPRAAEDAQWRVWVLGRFEAEDGEQRLQRLRSRAAMALLARVAMAPSREHPREELAALLWPDADAEAGRSRLRQTLSLLKATLEPPGSPPVLLADRRAVRAAPGALWCDAPALEQAVRQGRADEARQWYRGELLPGFFDEWIHDERQRLQGLMERLADAPPVATTPASASASAPGTPAGPAPLDQPPATSAPAAALRLPRHLTRWIGADQLGARLRTAVLDHRLVTVVGPGGSGKTRLALEVARLMLSAAAGGEPAAGLDGKPSTAAFETAVFASLVGAVTRAELLDRLLMALRIGTAGTPADQIATVLEGRRLLLILDNGEQLADDALQVLSELTERLPAVHWLATSRRPLGLDGEREFHMAGLPLPAADAPLQELARNPAVALFVDRARAHRPDFHLTAANREGLVALLRWLEGLPLAIELAAARSRALGPAEMLALLRRPDDATAGSTAGLAWLSRRGPRSGGDSRHASMLAVIEWSHALLSPAARELLAVLCQLPAGATLAAAAAGAADGQGAAWTLLQAQERLDELLAHSVIKLATGADGKTRHLPYEPVREYVLAQLAPDAALRLRHRRLYALLRWAQALPATPPLAEVREEMPNVVAAMSSAQADGCPNDAVQLVLVLQSTWGSMAVPGAALDVLGRLLDDPRLTPSMAGGGHAMMGTFCRAVGLADRARQHAEKGLQIEVDDGPIQCMVWSRCARLLWFLSRDAERVRALIDRALPLARELDRPNTEASLLSLQAQLATVVDKDPERARALVAQAAELWRQSGNVHLIHIARYNVAGNLIETGRHAEGLPEMQALAAEGLAQHHWILAANALDACGTALQGLRRWREAALAHRSSLQVAWDNAEIEAVLFALWNTPPLLVRMGEPILAARTMGAAEALWKSRFGPFTDSDLRGLERVRRLVRRRVPPLHAQAAWKAGQALSLADAVHALLAWQPAPQG